MYSMSFCPILFSLNALSFRLSAGTSINGDMSIRVFDRQHISGFTFLLLSVFIQGVIFSFHTIYETMFLLNIVRLAFLPFNQNSYFDPCSSYPSLIITFILESVYSQAIMSSNRAFSSIASSSSICPIVTFELRQGCLSSLNSS